MAKKRTLYPTAKPYKGFPLTPRADGRFVKRIHGNLHVFGRRGDWRVALDEYLAVARAVHAGREPPAAAGAPTNVTVRQLINRYLDARLQDVRSGNLHLRTYGDYRSILSAFGRFVGPTLPVNELGTHHLDRYAAHLRDKLKSGPRRFNAARAHIRAFLRHSFDAPWIPAFPLGLGFKRAPRGSIRAVRKDKLITPRHLRILIDAADVQLRAMILLGINCAFGNTDCATLPRAAVDLGAAVVRYPRPKTNIARTIPLWPETVDALRAAVLYRPTDTLVFRTRHGNLWVRASLNAKGKPIPKDSLAQAFAVLLASVCDVAERKTLREIYKGVGFYALRHTHATYANEVRDADARRHIAGRKLAGLDDDYVEAFFLPRLRVIVDHVKVRALG